MNCSIPYAILLSGPKICTHSGFTPCANAGTAKTVTRIRATTTTAHSLVVVGCTTGSLRSRCPIFLAKFFASTTLTKNMTGNNKAEGTGCLYSPSFLEEFFSETQFQAYPVRGNSEA
jgi:hypothetical protein